MLRRVRGRLLVMPAQVDLRIEKVRIGLAGSSLRINALKASERCRTSSRFCCDIAYSRSPAASRASRRSRNNRMREILPSSMRTVS
jgi:hypothetical protein